MSCNLWQKAAITCKTCIARRVGKLGKVRQLLNYLKFEFIASDFSYKYRRFIFHSQKKRFRFFFFFFKRNSMTRRERERNTKFSFSRRLFFTSFRLKKKLKHVTHTSLLLGTVYTGFGGRHWLLDNFFSLLFDE